MDSSSGNTTTLVRVTPYGLPAFPSLVKDDAVQEGGTRGERASNFFARERLRIAAGVGRAGLEQRETSGAEAKSDPYRRPGAENECVPDVPPSNCSGMNRVDAMRVRQARSLRTPGVKDKSSCF